MLRSTALVALLATVTATGGCHVSSNAKTTMVVGGFALAGLGGLAIKDGEVDANHNGIDENPFDNDLGEQFLGMWALTAGVGLVLLGLASTVEEDAPPPVSRVAVPIATAAAMASPPALSSGPPAETEVIVDAQRLPELPASDMTLQLAKQVRTASARGKCDAAWIMWNQLDDLDARYAEALRAGPVMTTCSH